MTAGSLSGYNYHHILDLQAAEGPEIYSAAREDDNEQNVMAELSDGMVIGGPSVALLADEISQASSFAPTGLGKVKKTLFGLVALTTMGTGLMYMAPMASDLTGGVSTDILSTEPLIANMSSWNSEAKMTAGPAYAHLMASLDHNERRILMKEDVKCWSMSPLYRSTHYANGTRLPEDEIATALAAAVAEANSTAAREGLVDLKTAEELSKHLKPHIADPANCMPAPYLYITYHGGYEDFRVKNVCKYSRDGCSLGSVLLPDTETFRALAQGSTTTTTAPGASTTTLNATEVEEDAGISARKKDSESRHLKKKEREERQAERREEHRERRREEREREEEDKRSYQVHSLRGMMLSKGNLYVAEAWKENSLVLEYSQCLPELGDRRMHKRTLVGHQDMQETEAYNQTRDKIRGQAYVYEKPEEISDVSPDAAETWKRLRKAIEDALKISTGDKHHKKNSTNSSSSSESDMMMNGGEEGARSLSSSLVEVEEVWDRKQVNGLVHPYGFARAPHDPYLYISSQDTFAVLRYDMETGQPGPMSKGAMWYYSVKKMDENAREKERVIDYTQDDKSLDILRSEMAASPSLNKTVTKAIEVDGRDELEIARAYREVRKHRNTMYAGVMVDLMGNEIRGIVFDSASRLYVADKQKAVRVYDSDGFEIKHTLAHIPSPISLAFDKARNSLWVGSSVTHSLYEIDASTWRAKQVITSPLMEHPAGLQIWGDSLYVISQAQGKVLEFSVTEGILRNVVLDNVPDVGERVIMSPC